MIQSGLNSFTQGMICVFVVSLVYFVAFLGGWWARDLDTFSQWRAQGCRWLTVAAGAALLVSGMILALQTIGSWVGPLSWLPEEFLTVVATVTVGGYLLLLMLGRELRWRRESRRRVLRRMRRWQV